MEIRVTDYWSDDDSLLFGSSNEEDGESTEDGNEEHTNAGVWLGSTLNAWAAKAA